MHTAFRFVLLSISGIALTTQVLADGPAWSTSIEESLQEAAESGKPVLMEFTAPWCAYCKRMEKTTFTDPAVAARIEQEFVCVQVNADEHTELTEELGIEGLPTILIVSSDLKIQQKIKGYQTPKALMAELDKTSHTRKPATAAVAGRNLPARNQPPVQNPAARQPGLTAAETTTPHRRNPVQSVSRPNTVPPARAKQETEEASASESDPSTEFFESLNASEEKPKTTRQTAARTPRQPSFGGTSLVSAVEQREIVPGSARHSLEYRGRLLYFANAEEKEKFESDPARYWPMLDGNCPVTLLNDGKESEGQLQFAAVYRKHIWVFTSEASMKEFLADPADVVEAVQEILSEQK